MKKQKVPVIHSLWTHISGRHYKVLSIANQHALKERYPITVVYMDNAGRIWARPLLDWHRSMKEKE